MFGVLQVSWGVSCLLFIIGLLCTGRQARPSLTTLCKMGHGKENKACAAGTFRGWGFAGKAGLVPL